MLYEYEYEDINGRDCLVGGASWNEERKTAPRDRLFLAGRPLPGPDEMMDSSGGYRYVRDANDMPVIDPLLTEEDEQAAKEKKVRIKNIIEELATLMIDQNVKPADMLDKIKQRAVK